MTKRTGHDARLFLITASLITTGCTPELASWSQAQSVQASDIKSVIQSHPVRFAAGSAVVTAEEGRSLSVFLQSAAAPGAQAALVVPAPASAVSERRRAVIEGILRQQDIGASAVSAGTVPSDSNVITVRVGHYVASRPPCPDQNMAAADGFADTPYSFGCATATDIAVMAANPRDLVAGSPADGEDASYAARAVELYRGGGLAKSLPASGGGGSGQGGGASGAGGN